MQAYAEGLRHPCQAPARRRRCRRASTSSSTSPTSPRRARRGRGCSVSSSWLLDLSARWRGRRADLATPASSTTRAKAAGRCTAALEEAVPALDVHRGVAVRASARASPIRSRREDALRHAPKIRRPRCERPARAAERGLLVVAPANRSCTMLRSRGGEKSPCRFEAQSAAPGAGPCARTASRRRRARW